MRAKSHSIAHSDAHRFISFTQGVIDDVGLDLPAVAQGVFRNSCQHLGALHEQVRWYEVRLRQEVKRDSRVRLSQTISGVGPVTASALAASIGDGHQFKNGREFAAWLGLTPTNKSTGGKERLGRITKMGDQYGVPILSA